MKIDSANFRVREGDTVDLGAPATKAEPVYASAKAAPNTRRHVFKTTPPLNPRASTRSGRGEAVPRSPSRR
jgi:hypothetical protein